MKKKSKIPSENRMTQKNNNSSTKQFHNNTGDNKNTKDKLKMTQSPSNIENNKNCKGKMKHSINMINTVNCLISLQKSFKIMLGIPIHQNPRQTYGVSINSISLP